MSEPTLEAGVEVIEVARRGEMLSGEHKRPISTDPTLAEETTNPSEAEAPSSSASAQLNSFNPSKRGMIDADLSREKQKKNVDKLAAAYILQGLLDRLRIK